MAPTKPKKRGSDASTKLRAGVAVPLKDEPSTPTRRSPIRKRAGITLQQKKTLIENLQLEITERARRLRAQYHLQAQGLRSRVEIRVNRIPTSLRKMKMDDLLLKYLNQEQGERPPVPAKDLPPRAATHGRAQLVNRSPRRLSEICGDKENDIENDGVKKRPRGAMGDKGYVRPAQVLSPTSSNSRLVNRDNTASPTKPSYLNRPGSPLKSSGTGSAARATSVLSSMVERAKAARSGATKKAAATSTASARAGTTATTAKTRRGGATTKQPSSRPATRTGRRASNQSETSEGSATTVVRKTAPSKASTATTKKSVMGSIRKGTAAKKATAPTTSSSGRVLRKRT